MRMQNEAVGTATNLLVGGHGRSGIILALFCLFIQGRPRQSCLESRYLMDVEFAVLFTLCYVHHQPVRCVMRIKAPNLRGLGRASTLQAPLPREYCRHTCQHRQQIITEHQDASTEGGALVIPRACAP
jgi:hypothetical protein